jgi:hypothetical protein
MTETLLRNWNQNSGAAFQNRLSNAHAQVWKPAPGQNAVALPQLWLFVAIFLVYHRFFTKFKLLMRRIIGIILPFILLLTRANGQNLFPVKVEGCEVSRFCLDCGDPKATYDEESFDQIIKAINTKYNFKGASGQIALQVLVDSSGKGCVLSHNDASKNAVTLDLIQYLNQCKWRAAIEDNKPVASSINIVFELVNDQLSGKIKRVDLEAFSDNMRNPGTPEVYNKTYHYENPSLGSYEITVWQKENSDLPNDMGQHCVADKNDDIWYGTYGGFVKFDGKKMTRLNEKNSPFKAKESISEMAVDRNNNKWVATGDSLYRFDNKKWSTFLVPGRKAIGAFGISCNDFGETFICSDSGLIIIKNDKATILTKKEIKELPSNHIFYAFRDLMERLWIGTFKGAVMIDKNNKVTTFNQSETPLKETTITDAVQDENGNIYFALYAYIHSDQRDRPEEGFARLSKDGKWSHYNDINSGLPADHVNSLWYDKFEEVLWIGTNEAGLVRYDLKDGWENYHNKNSEVPSSYVFQITQDSKGNLYVATFNGMMRIARNK